MLSKARIKFIKSLQVKKYRQQEQRFVVEGAKTVLEVLKSDYQTECLLGTEEFLRSHTQLLSGFKGEQILVNQKDMTSLGGFKTNDSALAIAKMKANDPISVDRKEFVFVLDDIRDPGNLGTIIRICDWYGIEKIIASENTTELYNPKVLHASMGSFTRVSLFYTDIGKFLSGGKHQVFGAFLDGESVHQVDWGSGGLVVVGNEAHGISGRIEKVIPRRISIPKYGGAESLNAAVATAVICDNIRRSYI